jgi:hypothetical protein
MVDQENLSARPRLFTLTTGFLGGAALVLLILSVPIAKMMRGREVAAESGETEAEVAVKSEVE